MTTQSVWAAQQLAELLAVLANAADDHAAIADALERLAESFEADAGAFLHGDAVVAALGWGQREAPEPALIAVAAGECETVEVPGLGLCETVVVPVDRDEGTALLLARAGHHFGREEVVLLRAMTRVLALALRLRGTVEVMNEALDDAMRQALHDELTGLPNRA